MFSLWSVILPVIFYTTVHGCNKVTFQNTLFRLSIDEVGDFSKHQNVNGCITPITVTSKVSIIECYNQSIPILREGAIQNMPVLTTLVFTGNSINKIKAAAFINLSKLEELILSKNKIKTIDVGVFSVLPSVSIIRLDENELAFLNEGIFTNMPNLRKLILSKNQLDTIEFEWFDQNSGLSVLSLSDNVIRRVPKDAFKNINKIEIMDLSNNRILTIHETAFKGLTGLYNLDLSDNRIFQMTGDLFAPLTNIESLYLHGNNLTYIHDQVLADISPTLKEISIYSNPWQCACYNNILKWANRDFNLKINYSDNCRIDLSPICVTPSNNPSECLEDIDEELDSTFYQAFSYENKTCDIDIPYR